MGVYTFISNALGHLKVIARVPTSLARVLSTLSRALFNAIPKIISVCRNIHRQVLLPVGFVTCSVALTAIIWPFLVILFLFCDTKKERRNILLATVCLYLVCFAMCRSFLFFVCYLVVFGVGSQMK